MQTSALKVMARVNHAARKQWPLPPVIGHSGARAFSAAALPASYESWLRQMFPAYFTDTAGESIPFAAYHHDLWQWVWALRPGIAPSPLIAVWPRGGGKSTSVELACVAMGMFHLRRYALYISSRQEQADDHVGNNIASMFETINVDRLVGKYGSSRGWRHNRVRTMAGFTVDALGLDVAARGVKLEDARPDVLILDDLDEENDTERAILKKIRSLTRKLIPAGSGDLAVMGVQNLIHDQGIFSRLVDGRADFLSTRTVSGPYPAIHNLQVEGVGKEATIVSGDPLWLGLAVPRCQQMIRTMGYEAFMAECQHETVFLQGTMFGDLWQPGVHSVEPFLIPPQWGIRRSFDWGSSKPFSVGWWAHSDGATPAPDGRIYPKATRFRIMELYGWNGKPNEGLRLANTKMAERILDVERASPYAGRVQPGPADSAIFDVVNGTSVADEMGTMGLLWTPAQKGPGSRRQGWQVMRDQLEAATHWPMEGPGLFVFNTCRQFIRLVPIAPKDIVDPDDIHSDFEDHVLDEVRYECTMPFIWNAGRIKLQGY